MSDHFGRFFGLGQRPPTPSLRDGSPSRDKGRRTPTGDRHLRADSFLPISRQKPRTLSRMSSYLSLGGGKDKDKDKFRCASPGPIMPSFDMSNLENAPNESNAPEHGKASKSGLFYNESDQTWHNPSLLQMVETLQVALMTARPDDPIPIQYNSYVLHLIEGIAKLQTRLEEAEGKIDEIRLAEEKRMADFDSTSTEWMIKDKQYKEEIKRLEKMLARTSKDGMEAVALARSDSIVNRNDTRRFHEKIQRLKSDRGNPLAKEETTRSASQLPVNRTKEPSPTRPDVYFQPAFILDADNDRILSDRFRRQGNFDQAVAPNPWPHGRNQPLHVGLELIQAQENAMREAQKRAIERERGLARLEEVQREEALRRDAAATQLPEETFRGGMGTLASPTYHSELTKSSKKKKGRWYQPSKSSSEHQGGREARRLASHAEPNAKLTPLDRPIDSSSSSSSISTVASRSPSDYPSTGTASPSRKSQTVEANLVVGEASSSLAPHHLHKADVEVMTEANLGYRRIRAFSFEAAVDDDSSPAASGQAQALDRVAESCSTERQLGRTAPRAIRSSYECAQQDAGIRRTFGESGRRTQRRFGDGAELSPRCFQSTTDEVGTSVARSKPRASNLLGDDRVDPNKTGLGSNLLLISTPKSVPRSSWAVERDRVSLTTPVSPAGVGKADDSTGVEDLPSVSPAAHAEVASSQVFDAEFDPRTRK